MGDLFLCSFHGKWTKGARETGNLSSTEALSNPEAKPFFVNVPKTVEIYKGQFIIKIQDTEPGQLSGWRGSLACRH